ncbi:hypothetical protein LG311_03210 [Sutcliffiella horikoshii]|uniref:hypothetical protein n=1 Tax=Sutcliffiella horikoshii TaxID=79883 RepID=UPI00384D48D1
MLSRTDHEISAKRKSVAGSNEKLFSSYFTGKFGENALNKPLTFKDTNNNVSISVDNSINKQNKNVLIEIDSGNMAKLLVGQYVLLNELCDNKSETVFLVIHYYKDRHGNEYNPQRTELNLSLVNNNIYEGKGLKYKVFNKSGFENFCDGISDLNKLIDELFSK